MNTNSKMGPGRTIVMIVLAVAATLCGVDAIFSDSVTTPARFDVGEDYRVYGTDTVLVGVGWILMGLSIAAKAVLHRAGQHFSSVIAVILAVIGALFWFAVM